MAPFLIRYLQTHQARESRLPIAPERTPGSFQLSGTDNFRGRRQECTFLGCMPLQSHTSRTCLGPRFLLEEPLSSTFLINSRGHDLEGICLEHNPRGPNSDTSLRSGIHRYAPLPTTPHCPPCGQFGRFLSLPSALSSSGCDASPSVFCGPLFSPLPLERGRLPLRV